MDIPFDILEKIDVINLIAMAAMFLFFYNRVDKKFEKVDQRFEKIDQRFDKVDHRFQKLEEDMQKFKMDMIEVKTILRMKECCMIQDERQMKKAE